jgi:muconolactone delta-isomerase
MGPLGTGGKREDLLCKEPRVMEVIMRFLVVTEGRTVPPPEMGPAMLDALGAWADRHTASGKMEQIWGLAGVRGGAGTLNVDSLEELDEIMTQSPVGPFSDTRIYPLIDVHEAIAHGKQAMAAMMAGMRR